MNTMRQQALLILDLLPAPTDNKVIFEVVNSARSNMVNSHASTECHSLGNSNNIQQEQENEIEEEDEQQQSKLEFVI